MSLYLLYPAPTSANVPSKSCFTHAPYIGGMSKKKEERAKQRMYDSQIDAIRQLRWIRETNGLTQEDVAKKDGDYQLLRVSDRERQDSP